MDPGSFEAKAVVCAGLELLASLRFLCLFACDLSFVDLYPTLPFSFARGLTHPEQPDGSFGS
jgi:hypothetical protein